jgi:hypothetical protein
LKGCPHVLPGRLKTGEKVNFDIEKECRISNSMCKAKLRQRQARKRHTRSQ